MTQLTFSRKGDTYSDEDCGSLGKHLETKRPRLTAAMKSFNILGLDFLGEETVTGDCDSEVIAPKMEQALSIEQAEAARHSCIWHRLSGDGKGNSRIRGRRCKDCAWTYDLLLNRVMCLRNQLTAYILNLRVGNSLRHCFSSAGLALMPPWLRPATSNPCL